MTYKILCSDLDGTLLTYKDNVSEYTINEIKRIRNHMRVVLVSARMPKSMIYIQKSLGIEDQPIICYNGALVLNGKKELSSTFIELDLIEGIYKEANKLDIKLGLYSGDEWYVESDSERVQKEIKYTKALPQFRDTQLTLKDWYTRKLGGHKIMMMGKKENMDTIFPILSKTFSNTLNLYRSNDTLIEVAPKSVSKLTAISLLLHPGENLEDVIAFGDNYNDIEMLQHAGHGVAVGNAREEVKEISQAITLKNTEDGVAHYIKQHLYI
ncbi:Cof-type HAD-IIB family hydrolase [Arenibacter latericius]|uniref:Cof-type HAD-IIB family hydrolase n=1 Tax=Arenibacter latericius TaxID=86104 RepID=UPI00041D714B|nr:Cof-type HAD-IIB family hydrolase [Arenibacter latericius]